MYNFQKTYSLPLLILISGLFLIYLVDRKIEQTELQKREARIQKESNAAVAQFQKGINKLAILTSGIRSYIESGTDLPAKEDLQSYLKTQFEYLSSNDSLIVSFIDTNHIFRYSVTPNSVSPNNLAGSSVKKIRDTAAIARLDKLLTYQEFRLFPPINMVEGYVGIPLNFRVLKEGKAIGYIASLINFESIINDLYLNNENSKDFVYRFSTETTGNNFDRVAYYDGSKVHNNRTDEFSFKNFDIPNENFIYQVCSNFGYGYNIGVAFKTPYKRSWLLIGSIIAWFTLLLLGVILFINRLKGKIKSKTMLLDQTESELDKKTEVLDSFKYISSHDLKEPLRSLVSFSMILKRRYAKDLDQNANEYLDYITSSANQMNNVLDDLVKFINLSETSEETKTEINLNETIEDIHANLTSVIKSRNVSINKDSLPTIYGNPKWISLLFRNLISNAIKFNDKSDPTIFIGSRVEKDGLVFFVKDNGMGIPKEFHGKVLQIFQRLSKKEKGTGIGLAICKKIIEKYNGKIWIDSDESRSTTFYFTLPNCLNANLTDKSNKVKTNKMSFYKD